MNQIITHSIIGMLVLGTLSAVVLGQTFSPSKDLPNLSKVATGIYRGGQPTEAGITMLKSLGITTIINLRDNDDRAKTEEKLATAAGIKFINIPLSNFFSPHDEKIEAILRQMTAAENQPVFVHCKRGSDRTGVAVAVYRMSQEGWTAEQANAEAKKMGFGWWQIWMKDYIDDYYRDHKPNGK